MQDSSFGPWIVAQRNQRRAVNVYRGNLGSSVETLDRGMSQDQQIKQKKKLGGEIRGEIKTVSNNSKISDGGCS